MNFYESLASGAGHPISIRQAHPAELPHAQALHHATLPSHRPLSEIIAKAHHEAAIHMSAFDGQKMVASVTLTPVTGKHFVYEVDRITTSPEFRGRGIGKQIMLAAEQLAKEKGAKEVILKTNPTAHTFFSDLGYSETGHPGDANVTMAKKLEPGKTEHLRPQN